MRTFFPLSHGRMQKARAQRETRERRQQVEKDRDEETEVNEQEQEVPTPRQGHQGKAPVFEGHALGLIHLSASRIRGLNVPQTAKATN